jgi:hypothetical protein
MFTPLQHRRIENQQSKETKKKRKNILLYCSSFIMSLRRMIIIRPSNPCYTLRSLAAVVVSMTVLWSLTIVVLSVPAFIVSVYRLDSAVRYIFLRWRIFFIWTHVHLPAHTLHLFNPFQPLPERKQRFSITKICLLMLFEINAVYSENHTRHENALGLCGQNAVLLIIIAGGSYSYHWV